MTVTGDCGRFHYFSFETLFLSTGVPFLVENSATRLIRLIVQQFHTKFPYQKLLLRQIE